MEEARCKDWADLRNYTIIPKEEIFRHNGREWELVE
jgi:hypothetical protein